MSAVTESGTRAKPRIVTGNPLANVLPIAGRELRSYFTSPVAYVLAALYLLINGWLFAGQLAQSVGLLNGQEVRISDTLGVMGFLFIFIAPILTMRLLAEEQATGTIELLLTAPVRDYEVVLGKFLAMFAYLLVLLGLTLVYPLVLFIFGNPDRGPMASGYLGVILEGSAMLSIGLLASSLTRSQVIAVFLGFAMLLLLWIPQAVAGFFQGSAVGKVLTYLTIFSHTDSMMQGVIDTKDVIYYLSIIAISLFLATAALGSRRWR